MTERKFLDGRSCWLWAAMLVLAAAVSPLWAQNYNATITGTVTDSTKAVVPGAKVTVHNTDTNQDIVVKTNNSGSYTVPYLKPEQHYVITVEAQGFKKAVLTTIAPTVGQVATGNVQLEPGAVNEEVTVQAESAPLLDMQKADIGSILDKDTITEMPVNGRNVFGLLTLSAGVTNQYGEGWNHDPADHYTSTYVSINGGAVGNTNVTIDGMSANGFVWYGNGVNTIPTMDAIEEVKIVTSPYDASYGHTAGGVMDLALKSGTRDLHFAAWEFYRRPWLDANTYWGDANDYPLQGYKQDQYGGEIDGPVIIPHLYNGRNKTFFMFSSEFYRYASPNPQYFDVPDPQWFNGDFSNLYDLYGNQIPIYDPDTANAANNYQRTQFANNMIPSGRLDSVALALMSYFPKANYPSANHTPPYGQPWEQAWFNSTPSTENFNNYLFRIDELVGTKDHFFFDFHKNNTTEWNWWGPAAVGSNGDLPFQEISHAYGVDWVHSFSPSLITDIRANYNRYWRETHVIFNDGFDLTKLGLPAALQQQVVQNTQLEEFPFVQPSGFFTMGRDFYYMPNDSYNFAPSATWIHGNHTTRFGADVGVNHYTDNTNWDGGLQLNFDQGATQEWWYQGGSDTPSGNSGNTIATMLLGDFGGGNAQIEAAIAPIYSWHYYAPWVEDDWKITKKLTLNLGLRWDFDGPPSERHNAINYDFDFNAVSPVNDEINRSAFPNLGTLKGGLTFAGVGGNGTTSYNLDKWDVQPRIGFAYAIHPRTVLRGGYGRFYISPTTLPVNIGYSIYEYSVSSLDGGRTILPKVLDNPFPSGLKGPPGNSQGLMTDAGLSVSYNNRNTKTPYTQEFTVGLEQTVGHDGVFSLSYVTTRSEKGLASLSTADINTPLWRSCDYTVGGDQTNCNGLKANPFYGLSDVDPSMSDSTTISNYQLSRPYPQFTGITENLVNNQHSWYHSMQAAYRERIHSVDLNVAYTFAKLMQSGGYIDQVYLVPMRHLSSMDQANRLTTTAILELPIGRGRKYLSSVGHWADTAIGGWNLSGIISVDSGQPWSMPSNANPISSLRGGAASALVAPGVLTSNINPCAEQWQSNGSDPTGRTGQWVLTPNSVSLGCSLDQAAWRVRTGYMEDVNQGYTDQIRNPGYFGLDTNLSKTFAFTERLRMELRLECFNVLNHPTWQENYDNGVGDATFGTINKAAVGQSNQARQVQLGAKITF